MSYCFHGSEDVICQCCGTRYDEDDKFCPLCNWIDDPNMPEGYLEEDTEYFFKKSEVNGGDTIHIGRIRLKRM